MMPANPASSRRRPMATAGTTAMPGNTTTDGITTTTSTTTAGNAPTAGRPTMAGRPTTADTAIATAITAGAEQRPAVVHAALGGRSIDRQGGVNLSDADVGRRRLTLEPCLFYSLQPAKVGTSRSHPLVQLLRPRWQGFARRL